ncbi:MAG TPA: DUF3124 domain-containing protein [Leptolyngbyaceae cyanobacterium M65_K2018_010]|nr:DUF3124 domain-containing protein [Leptolyngbyaceae cyanobacterium M65_K2018_010]
MVRGIPAIAGLVLLALNTGCGSSFPGSTVTGADLGLETNPGVTTLAAAQRPTLVTGQVIYVPIYSEIYDLGPNRTFQLAATLSLRNTDRQNPIVITAVDYYDSAGKRVKTYLTDPIQLAPLTSTAVVVHQTDTLGGTGANFLVTWGAAVAVSEPIVEAIMISTASQQGISFVSPGRVIEQR